MEFPDLGFTNNNADEIQVENFVEAEHGSVFNNEFNMFQNPNTQNIYSNSNNASNFGAWDASVGISMSDPFPVVVK